MSTTTQAVLSLVARILLSIIFILSGLMKIANWSAEADMMAAHGMPAIPFFLTLATIIEIAGGLALLLGLDFPMNGGHPVKGVQSPWEVPQCHARDAPTRPSSRRRPLSSSPSRATPSPKPHAPSA